MTTGRINQVASVGDAGAPRRDPRAPPLPRSPWSGGAGAGAVRGVCAALGRLLSFGLHGGRASVSPWSGGGVPAARIRLPHPGALAPPAGRTAVPRMTRHDMTRHRGEGSASPRETHRGPSRAAVRRAGGGEGLVGRDAFSSGRQHRNKIDGSRGFRNAPGRE